MGTVAGAVCVLVVQCELVERNQEVTGVEAVQLKIVGVSERTAASSASVEKGTVGTSLVTLLILFAENRVARDDPSSLCPDARSGWSCW